MALIWLALSHNLSLIVIIVVIVVMSLKEGFNRVVRRAAWEKLKPVGKSVHFLSQPSHSTHCARPNPVFN